jgi:hypothetical protein
MTSYLRRWCLLFVGRQSGIDNMAACGQVIRSRLTLKTWEKGRSVLRQYGIPKRSIIQRQYIWHRYISSRKGNRVKIIISSFQRASRRNSKYTLRLGWLEERRLYCLNCEVQLFDEYEEKETSFSHRTMLINTHNM